MATPAIVEDVDVLKYCVGKIGLVGPFLPVQELNLLLANPIVEPTLANARLCSDVADGLPRTNQGNCTCTKFRWIWSWHAS